MPNHPCFPEPSGFDRVWCDNHCRCNFGLGVHLSAACMWGAIVSVSRNSEFPRPVAPAVHGSVDKARDELSVDWNRNGVAGCVRQGVRSFGHLYFLVVVVQTNALQPPWPIQTVSTPVRLNCRLQPGNSPSSALSPNARTHHCRGCF